MQEMKIDNHLISSTPGLPGGAVQLAGKPSLASKVLHLSSSILAQYYPITILPFPSTTLYYY